MPSASSASTDAMSVLLRTRTTGFRVKSGLSVWKSAACCRIVYPHVPLTSTRKRMTHGRCASAVTACISMTFRSSSGWSRIPGVSMTCHCV